MAVQHPRLQKRNGIYYMRVAVPRHLQSLIGKREVCRSLGTRSYSEALQRLRLESPKIDQSIKEAETSGQLDKTLYPVRQMVQHQLPEKGVTLSELIKLYLAAPKRQNLAQKSLINYNLMFGFFKEVMGEDTPVRSFSRQDCREVRDLLIALPANPF